MIGFMRADDPSGQEPLTRYPRSVDREATEPTGQNSTSGELAPALMYRPRGSDGVLLIRIPAMLPAKKRPTGKIELKAAAHDNWRQRSKQVRSKRPVLIQ